jgi:hypothetical protein
MSESVPAELSSYDEVQLDRLRYALATKAGFQLVVLEVPEGRLRDAVLARVLAWSGKDGVPVLEVFAVEPSDDLGQELLSRKAKAGVVMIGIDDARHPGPRVDRAFGGLNWIRDQLPRAVKGPLVLVVSPAGVGRLLGKAPDLASSRAHTCRIGAGEGEPADEPLERGAEDQGESPRDPLTQMLLRVSTMDNVYPRLPKSLPMWLANRFSTIHDVVRIIEKAGQLIENASTHIRAPGHRLRIERVPLSAGVTHAWYNAIREASAISPYAVLAILLVARDEARTGGVTTLDDAVQSVLAQSTAVSRRT